MKGTERTLAEVRAAVYAALGMAGITAGYSFLHVTNATIVSLTFLTLVLAAATLSTLRVAVATSLVAMICFNYFFLPPVGTLTIADPQNWVALSAFLAVSLVASNLSSTARRQTADALARRHEVMRLFDLTRDILMVPEGPDGLTQMARFIMRRFKLDHALICVLGTRGWEQHGPADSRREPTDRLERIWAGARATLEFDAYERTYGGHDVTEISPGVERAVIPLRLAEETLGLLVIEGPACEPGARDAIAGVAALAIERLQLLEGQRQAEVVRRSSELRSALFASVSHDLRTPLTAISVAAANIQAPTLTDSQRADQIAVVQQEVQRLNRLFQNIVDMARIETASVTLEREPVAAADVIEAAQQLVDPSLVGRHVEVADRAPRALFRIDPRLTSTALAHLLENAAQYSPAGSAIDLTAWTEDAELRLSVRDRGAGIAAGDRARLFDRFQRGVESVRHPFGSGLGLAITKGLLVAQGGRVWADNHPDGGAVFTIAVPVTAQ